METLADVSTFAGVSDCSVPRLRGVSECDKGKLSGRARIGERDRQGFQGVSKVDLPGTIALW